MAMNNDAPYLTVKNMVYLGRTDKATRRRAKAAGLVIITAARYVKIIDRMSAAGRMIHEGRWYDTVRY